MRSSHPEHLSTRDGNPPSQHHPTKSMSSVGTQAGPRWPGPVGAWLRSASEPPAFRRACTRSRPSLAGDLGLGTPTGNSSVARSRRAWSRSRARCAAGGKGRFGMPDPQPPNSTTPTPPRPVKPTPKILFVLLFALLVVPTVRNETIGSASRSVANSVEASTGQEAGSTGEMRSRKWFDIVKSVAQPGSDNYRSICHTPHL